MCASNPYHPGCPPQRGTKEYDHWQVQNILHGQEDQWELLYKSAYRTASQCAVRADGEKIFGYSEYHDIVDEAFALCYAHLARYEGRSRFGYWVGGYARNITRNRCYREGVRRRKLGTLQTAAKQQMTDRDPMFILIRREKYSCLWRAFYELDEISQSIIDMRIFQDMKYSQIGEQLHLSRQEALRRYGSAIEELRQRFVGYYKGQNGGVGK